MKRLAVYLNSTPVGTLIQDAGGLLWFQYASEWLERSDAMPLSRSLPLRREPFRGKRARPFFAGLLPDEAPRKQIAGILGESARNDFSLLEKIGGDCAGAVALLPDGVFYPRTDNQQLRKLSARELEEVIAELPRRPLLAGKEGIRLSLAGSQPKLPVIIHESTVALPLGNTPSTHIIKPEPERFGGLAANEAFCMTLAKSIGLNVPSVATRTIGGKACIIVQRYDRFISPDGVVRIHQEDFCQAMGFPPERKYQQEGGPLLRDCIDLLRDWSSIPTLDVRDFLDGLIFNVLIGNADAHGKNYSILYREGQRRLAPFYDLVCTLACPELSKTPAMKIGNSTSIEDITAAHWQRMAEETHVGWPMLRDRIAELSGKAIVALEDSDVRNNAGDASTVRHVAGIIEKRATSLASQVTRAPAAGKSRRKK